MKQDPVTDAEQITVGKEKDWNYKEKEKEGDPQGAAAAEAEGEAEGKQGGPSGQEQEPENSDSNSLGDTQRRIRYHFGPNFLDLKTIGSGLINLLLNDKC